MVDNTPVEPLKKREKKSLSKIIERTQLSTASMGKFDKKVHKTEKDAPGTQKQKLISKRRSKEIGEVGKSLSVEKERNLKILGLMYKKEERKAGSKADANLDV